MKQTRFYLIVLTLVLILLGTARADDDWREAFDAICSQTQAAEALTLTELKELIDQSDALIQTIDTSNDPKKKVYIFRLKKCRNLFAYLAALKENRSESE